MRGLRLPWGRPDWRTKLSNTLARGCGVRMGEAAVVSRQLHASEPTAPEVIYIHADADFGQVTYGRQQKGDVAHIDILHAIAQIDHRRVAAAIRRALEGTGLADYVDIGTATGAGRVTGSLDRACRPSALVAHRNHVHIACLLSDQELHHLLALVQAVEAEIIAQGVELRRVERLSHRRGRGGSVDLSDLTRYYGADLDSRIGPGPSGSPGQGQEGGASGSAGGRGLPGLNSRGAPGRGAVGGAPAPDAAADQPGRETLGEEERLQAAVELARKLGSPDELKRILDDLGKEQGWSALYGSGSSQAPFVLRQLEEAGLVRKEVRGMRLTEAGKGLAAYLERHLRDVKLRFRKQIRRVPGRGAHPPTRRPGPSMGPPSADVRYGLIRGAAPAEPGAWLGDLAVPETLWAALRRTRLARIAGPTASGALRLERSDLHVQLRAAERPMHICLLIDASASMAGRRILAAKHLARHLLVSTRDKIAVIAFQERDVQVYVPFTRDYNTVEAGLSQIQPMGLTPLAHGLLQSLDLIRGSRVRRPLLLLITDGIPTVPKWSIDPLADALEAAKQVRQGRIPFGCIGLQPSRRYLDQLAQAAGGTLHVVEELNEESLVLIAHAERQKLALR